MLNSLQKVQQLRFKKRLKICSVPLQEPYLGAPQFDGPVERGGDKQVGEVQRACSCVTVDPSDGPLVALKHLTNPRLAVEHTDPNEHGKKKKEENNRCEKLTLGLNMHAHTLQKHPERATTKLKRLTASSAACDYLSISLSMEGINRRRWTSPGHAHSNRLLISCNYQQGGRKRPCPFNHMLQSCYPTEALIINVEG